MLERMPVSLWKSPWPERLRRALPRLLLCLDYDGTLTPIAERPDEARPPAALLTLLSRLVEHPASPLLSSVVEPFLICVRSCQYLDLCSSVLMGVRSEPQMEGHGCLCRVG